MTPCSDFLKLSTYHDILGPRLAGRLDGYRKHFLRDLSPEQTLALYYSVAGHDAKVEPALDQLAESGLTPEYVYRETKRGVDSVAGKSAIYAGIATDIPRGTGWGTEAWPSDPDEVSRCVRRALDAGAWHRHLPGVRENRRASLEAIGRAVRES